MCGRYALSVSKRPELKAVGLQVVDRYNIAPQSEVLVYDNERHIQQMRWDYSPPWAQKPLHLTNARSETLREKPAFRGAMRCVFLADGWYEWQQQGKRKIPYYHHANGKLIYFAGIYNRQSGCAIVTRESRENIAFVHHRQPVLLDERAIDHWLAGHDLFASAITQAIQCHPVSSAVNQPANDYSDLQKPVEAPLAPKTSAPSFVPPTAKQGSGTVSMAPEPTPKPKPKPEINAAQAPSQLSIYSLTGDTPTKGAEENLMAAVSVAGSEHQVKAGTPLKHGESGDLFS